jgi:hypothetical protein
MSTAAKEVKDRRSRDPATIEQEQTTTEASKASNSTSSSDSSRGHFFKHNCQEWVLHADTQMLRKEPRNTIFDENGVLSEQPRRSRYSILQNLRLSSIANLWSEPKYQVTNIPPLASGVSVYLEGSSNQAPTLIKRAKLPLSARANRILGRNKKLYTYVPWACWLAKSWYP